MHTIWLRLETRNVFKFPLRCLLTLWSWHTTKTNNVNARTSRQWNVHKNRHIYTDHGTVDHVARCPQHWVELVSVSHTMSCSRCIGSRDGLQWGRVVLCCCATNTSTSSYTRSGHRPPLLSGTPWVCVCECLYIHTYIHTYKQTHTHTHKPMQITKLTSACP